MRWLIIPTVWVLEKSRRQTQLLQHFQSRWKKKYLTSLQEVHKATGTNIQTVKVGDVVLTHNDIPRLQWRLAVIEELIKGLDGFVRAAMIWTNSGKINQSIAKLYPLEINGLEDNEAPICEWRNTVFDDDLGNDDATSVPCRSMRKAAVRAHNIIKNWTSVLSAALRTSRISYWTWNL